MVSKDAGNGVVELEAVRSSEAVKEALRCLASTMFCVLYYLIEN